MNHIDAKGKACPMPVMMAKKEMDTGCEALSITVDNAIAALPELVDKITAMIKKDKPAETGNA